MTSRFVVVLALPLVLASASAAVAADGVQPRAGIVLTGMIKFPREQQMMIETDPGDGFKLTVRMGFDGRCKGGGIGEAWASLIETRPTVRVRDGRLFADLKGTTRNLGGVKGRTGDFKWRLTGRFLAEDVVTATVSGSVEIRNGKRVISRCKIAKPAAVRLALRSS
jgi:hypothetical protein